MKRWKKVTLWTIGGILAGVLIFIGVMWSTIDIVKGTENLDGQQAAIPDVLTSAEKEILEKGDSDWTSWLGMTGNGRSNFIGIRNDWSLGLSKLWEVNYLCQGDVSATWSAPVIQGDRLIVCGRDSIRDLVFCIHATDGRLIWLKSYETKAITNHGAGSRATPVIDDDRVYTFGRSGDLVCWNLGDGQELWRQNVSVLGGKEPTWGHSSSPLIWRHYIIVQGGGDIRTIAFDKMTGEIAWKSGVGVAGYAALTSMDIAGKPVVISFHGKGLAALDIENGNELWNIVWETSYDVNATTPVITGDRVFITSGYNTGCAMLKVDTTKADVLWQNKTFAAVHSDPYIIDDYLYGYSGQSYQNKGTFKCLDVQDGTERWTTNEMGWGTSTFVDGHLICCDIKGNLYLMQPDPEKFIKKSHIKDALGKIKGPVWTKPVIANGLLYLRFKQRLVCYDLVNE